MNQWEVISSHDLRGVVTSIEINEDGFAISSNTNIHFLNFKGKEIWKKKLPFKPLADLFGSEFLKTTHEKF